MAGSVTLATELAAFAVGLDERAVPPSVKDAAKLHTLDLIGTALASYGIGEGEYAVAASLELGGAGGATVIGKSLGRPPAVAALANGTLAHSIEFDDTHTDSITHISAVVVPAALATAEVARRSGQDTIMAIVVGTEAVARIGATASPSYMRTGFHPTSVCGVFGAALAACRLRRLNERQTVDAMGIAGSFASGLFEYLSDGSRTKAIHAGWAAHAGITSATLAEAGADGPASVLEGPHGVFSSHFRLDANGAAHEWDLGSRWETTSMTFKPYPACHFINGALDAARVLLARGLDIDDIDSIKVAVPAPAIPLVLEPVHHKVQPRTPFEAKFSLQFSLAAMLVDGQVTVATYSRERLGDGRLHELAALVQHDVEEFPSYPATLPARLTISLRDGSTMEEVSPGGSQAAQPPTVDDIVTKFRSNADLALDRESRELLEATILNLDGIQDVCDAFMTLRKAAIGARCKEAS